MFYVSFSRANSSALILMWQDILLAPTSRPVSFQNLCDVLALVFFPSLACLSCPCFTVFQSIPFCQSIDIFTHTCSYAHIYTCVYMVTLRRLDVLTHPYPNRNPHVYMYSMPVCAYSTHTHTHTIRISSSHLQLHLL